MRPYNGLNSFTMDTMALHNGKPFQVMYVNNGSVPFVVSCHAIPFLKKLHVYKSIFHDQMGSKSTNEELVPNLEKVCFVGLNAHSLQKVDV